MNMQTNSCREEVFVKKTKFLLSDCPFQLLNFLLNYLSTLVIRLLQAVSILCIAP